jgi:putative transposase
MRHVLTIMLEHHIFAQVCPTGVRRPETHDRTNTTAKPAEMWAVDATSYLAGEGNAASFVVVDRCTGECLGEPRRTVLPAIQGYLIPARGRPSHEGPLRHPNCQRHLATARSRLAVHLARIPGIESSPSFVRQPEGNGYVERLTRTIKEQLLWL